MEIRESLFSKRVSLENEDPYKLAMDFMRRVSENYRVYERKNVFSTDGPTKKSEIIFDILEILDSCARIRVEFSMESENNTLYIDVSGEFIIKIRQSGFFTDIFTEFYLNNIFPSLRKISEKRAKELETELGNI